MKYTRTETVTYEIKTKPCPFCGRQPQFCYDSGNYGYTPSYGKLYCSCGAQMRVVSYDNESESELLHAVVKAWNRRSK